MLCRNVLIYFGRRLQDDVHAPAAREPGDLRHPRPGPPRVDPLHALRAVVRGARRAREAVPEGALRCRGRSSWWSAARGAAWRRWAASCALLPAGLRAAGGGGPAPLGRPARRRAWRRRSTASARCRCSEVDDKDEVLPGTVLRRPRRLPPDGRRARASSCRWTSPCASAGPPSTCSSSRPRTSTVQGWSASSSPARTPTARPGCARIREFGGLTLVQDPATAERPEMPAAAVAAGVADRVLPLDGHRRGAGAPRAAPRRAGRGAVTKILVVDDRPENVVALEAVLEPLPATVVTASSGEEALRRLLDGDFAVILLDVQMPGMDGFETAEYAKQLERTRYTPDHLPDRARRRRRERLPRLRDGRRGLRGEAVRAGDPALEGRGVRGAAREDAWRWRRASGASRRRSRTRRSASGWWDSTGRWLAVNRALCEIAGPARGTRWCGSDWRDLLDRVRRRRRWRCPTRGEGARSQECRFRRADGALAGRAGQHLGRARPRGRRCCTTS